MSTSGKELHFPPLPLWQGAQPQPTTANTFPFSLGLSDEGYIHQTTPEDVQRRVVECYAKAQYSLPTTPPGASSWGDARGEAVLKAIAETHGDLSGSRVLDIGAGSTYVGERLVNEFGVTRCLIMDPSVDAVAQSDRVEVVRQYFSLDTCPQENFDLVLSVNCLEHIPAPGNFLRGIRKLIANSKGKALLLFPDTKRGFEDGDLNILLHEHISYFTPESVRRLTSACGLRILSCDTRDDAFHCYLEATDQPCGQDTGEDISLALAAKTFEQSQAHFRDQVMQYSQKENGLAFHGATNGLNNLLTLTGIMEQGLPHGIHIFDGDENKTGKYLPGCPIPIKNSNDPSYTQFEHVIVSAMTFYRPIHGFLTNRLKFAPQKIHPIYPMHHE